LTVLEWAAMHSMPNAQFYDRAYFLGHRSNYIFGYHQMRYRLLWWRRLALIRRLAPHGRLLDVGCAFGFFLRFLDGHHESYGIDVSAHAVEQARRVVEVADRVQQADIQETMPFPHQFELITAFDLVEHLPRPEAAVRQLAQATKPGGYVVLELPTREPLLNRDGSHVYRQIAYWTSLLEGAGYQILRVQGYWTIGLRIILIPARRRANYHQIIARRPPASPERP